MTGAPDISSLVSSPLLYGAIVLIGWLVWLFERLTNTNGLFSRVNTWWSSREINRLVRQQEVFKARLALEEMEESALVRGLRQEVEALAAEMAWYRRERMDLAAREHHRAEFDRALAQWTGEWVPRARVAGLDIPDPPRYIELPPVVLPRWPGSDLADRRGTSESLPSDRNPDTNPHGQRIPPPPPGVDEDGDEGGMPRADPRASAR